MNPDNFFADGGGPIGRTGLARALQSIGLGPERKDEDEDEARGTWIENADLPRLLAAACSADLEQVGADPVVDLLAGVARDLRLLTAPHGSADRHHLIRNVAMRADVAAEVHRRMVIGLAHRENQERELQAVRLSAGLPPEGLPREGDP